VSAGLKPRKPGKSYVEGARLFSWAENVTAAILVSELDLEATRRQLRAGYLRVGFAFGTALPQLEPGTPWMWWGLADGQVHVGRLVDRRELELESAGTIDAREVAIERISRRYATVRLGAHQFTAKKNDARILKWWIEQQQLN
jgi:hypothetical protein